MKRQSSLEIMCSDEMYQLLGAESEDLFRMHIMQAYSKEIPDFIKQLYDYKGKAAAIYKDSDPEIAEKLNAYNFNPRDIIDTFNEYIELSFAEKRELAAKSLEVMENIDELGE